jgi:hypothetical protein
VLLTVDIPNVEILSVGSWHGQGCPSSGCTFTTDDLDTIVASHAATAGSLRPPVKLGHDDDQKLLQADGYPAAGWVTNLRRTGEKLIADLVGVPKKIAELMDAGAYRTRSVELDGNIDVGGTTYSILLTGLALLGADLPAVTSLADITALYASRGLTVPTKVAVFSAPVRTTTRLAIPAGMSASDLELRIKRAFIDASPGADEDAAWISDLYDDHAIVCLEGRYWDQAFTVAADGAVTLPSRPIEVERITEWRSVSASSGRRYAEDADRTLAALVALNKRTSQLVAMRANEGRTLSEQHRERLTRLHDGAARLASDLAVLLADAGPPKAPKPSTNAIAAVQARTVAARLAEINGS